MINNIVQYFSNLNLAGRSLFIVGILLIITFIIFLIVIIKPEKKAKKIYGESPLADSENDVLEKLKDIDNVSVDDINLENEKTKNLKTIVDELKSFENKQMSYDMIQKYEDEQESTAVISVNELLRATEGYIPSKKSYDKKIDDEEYLFDEPKKVVSNEVKKETHYVKPPEIFSSVNNTTKQETDNQKFLDSLKQFRNNL